MYSPVCLVIINMSSPEYLTGNHAKINSFIDKFDVRAI